MKRIIPLLVFMLLVVHSCKKQEEPSGAAPCPCTEDECIDELMAFSYFQVGSWWVYEEENSGQRDSVYVYEAFDGETEEGVRFFTMRVHSELDGYNYYYEFSETATLNIRHPECKANKVSRTKTRPGDFVGTGTVLSYYPFIDDTLFLGSGSIYTVDSTGMAFSQQVLVNSPYISTNVTNADSDDDVDMAYTFVKEFGLFQKTFLNHNQRWTLVNSHLIQ